ncbi:MAG: chromate transporter [Clostridia bacterium]|nr:chromate transporter [Clostridia bacterium]
MLLSLFWTFFKIGLFTFGGGYAMIANVREVVVEKRGWLSEEELLQVITIAESTPGPIAINLATYVGYRKRGFWGSLLATVGVVLPSLVIIFVISLFLDVFMANKYVAYAFVGIKCAVAFLILKAGGEMLIKMQKRPLPITVFAVVFVLMLLLELFAISFSAIWLILAGGAIGIVAYALFGQKRGGDSR